MFPVVQSSSLLGTAPSRSTPQIDRPRWLARNLNTLQFNHEPLVFGDLLCFKPENNGVVKLSCSSKGVADAGYSVVLIENDQKQLSAEVSEITFMGSKALATLRCSRLQEQTN